MAVNRADELKKTGSSCRRRTYFLSGFDPRGVAHYQRLFGRLMKQRDWRLGSRQEGERITRWPLLDPEVNQHYELAFLHWDDIARANWPKHPWPLLTQLLGFARAYLLQGGVSRLGEVIRRAAAVRAMCSQKPWRPGKQQKA